MSNETNETKVTLQKGEEALLLNHDYDGIKELDNPLPRWWVIVFYLCIFHSIGYFVYYEFLKGPTLVDEHNKEMDEIVKLREASAPKSDDNGSFDMDKFNAVIAAPDLLDKGKEVFIKNCVVCHKDKGQGDIGPNLADDYWIHGDGSPAKIFETVKVGVVDMGMPSWGDVLTHEELVQVVAYIKSFKGVKEEGAKEPQGNKGE